MLTKLINLSTNYLIRYQVIDEEDRDIYEYGFHSLYNNVIDITSIIVISILLNQVAQTIVYHISFILLRSFAGGYHAKTHVRCFVMSTAIWILSLWGINNLASPTNCIIFVVLSFALIWTKAPVEHIHNPLSTEKRKRMKRLARIFVSVISGVILLIYFTENNTYSWVAASLAYGMVSHMVLILGAIMQDSFTFKKESTGNDCR